MTKRKYWEMKISRLTSQKNFARWPPKISRFFFSRFFSRDFWFVWVKKSRDLRFSRNINLEIFICTAGSPVCNFGNFFRAIAPNAPAVKTWQFLSSFKNTHVSFLTVFSLLNSLMSVLIFSFHFIAAKASLKSILYQRHQMFPSSRS